MDLMRTFPDQKESTHKQDKVAPGDFVAKDHKQGRTQAHNPSERKQQGNAHEHGQYQPYGTRPPLLLGWELANQNGNEDDVIDTQHNFEDCKGQEPYPCLRIGEPFHMPSSSEPKAVANRDAARVYIQEGHNTIALRHARLGPPEKPRLFRWHGCRVRRTPL